ncbi:MAG: winged helix-turn-helix domain-containing protein [Candidatus Omnitrophica bacterium]|nr:winged helix-turn-helix domain-containing protein [Candidatus Omnitrophota bacterium]
MKPDSFRELKVLEEISSNTASTQRHLAQKLGVALGLTNLMIRRCIQKGYLKAVNVRKNRIQYLLTPKGVAEKTRLTIEYLEYSMHLYRRVRQILKETLQAVSKNGGKTIVFFGRGELSEITYLSVKEAGLNMVAIVDDQTCGESFLGLPVIETKALALVPFDCGIVSSLNSGWDKSSKQLARFGIPEEKIIVIEQNGAQIKAVPFKQKTEQELVPL